MGQQRQRGFTLVEIMIVVAIIALLAAIAIPNVLRGRATANESATIGNLRALISSLEMYRSVNNVYPAAATWQAQMYGADCDAATAPAPDYGPPSFCMGLTGAAANVVQGFIYTYTGAAAPAATYTIRAVPQVADSTGTRSFLANESGVVRHCLGSTGTVAELVDESTIDAVPTACD